MNGEAAGIVVELERLDQLAPVDLSLARQAIAPPQRSEQAAVCHKLSYDFSIISFYMLDCRHQLRQQSQIVDALPQAVGWRKGERKPGAAREQVAPHLRIARRP